MNKINLRNIKLITNDKLISLNHKFTSITHNYSKKYLHCGNLFAASGPFMRRFFFPTCVGTGGSYFFFFS